MTISTVTKRVATATLALGLAIMLVGEARAGQAITFGNLSVDHLSSAGPRTEGAFTYQAVSGIGWEVQNYYGNTGSGLATFFFDETSEIGDTVVIKRADAGRFTFESVDTMTLMGSWSDSVTITGYLGLASVGSLLLNAGTPNRTFVTIESTFTSTIDSLRVTITRGGGLSARILDNFVLGPDQASGAIMLPEPSTLASVLVAGLLVTGSAIRRGRNRD